MKQAAAGKENDFVKRVKKYVLVMLRVIHHDFFNHFTQEGVSEFFNGKMLADNVHKLSGI